MTLPRRIKKQSVRQSDRIRCPAHLKWVREHGCCVPNCTMEIIEAAHVRSGHIAETRQKYEDGGMGVKPGDNWAISLCWAHHARQHVTGEQEFEREYGIDMKKLAAEFAAKSDPLRRYLLERARKRAT